MGAGEVEAGQGHSILLVPGSIKIRISDFDQQNNLLFFWECSSEINIVTEPLPLISLFLRQTTQPLCLELVEWDMGYV